MSDATIAVAARDTAVAASSTAADAAEGAAESVATALAHRNAAQVAKTAAETARDDAQDAASTAATDALAAVTPANDVAITAVDSNAASAFRVQQDARLSNTFVATVSPLAHGAVGDNTADDTAALNAAAVAASAAMFGTVDGRGLTYRTTDTLVIPANVKITNATIHCTGTGKKIIDVQGDNVTVDVDVVGRHATATASLGEYGIYASGASAAAPLRNLTIRDFDGTLVGQYGIFLKWVDGFTITRPKLSALGYSGITTLSALNGVIDTPRITNVLAGFSGNGYGMAFSRDETSSLVTDPRSAYIKVVNPFVQGIPWEGIDTHAGEHIDIINPTVLGCTTGIKITDCDGAGDVPMFAPRYVRVRGGLIDSLVDDGSAGAGIEVNGVAGATAGDAAADYALGISVQGVTIRRHGNQASSNSGAILCRNTYGFHESGNDFDQPSPAAVSLYYDNRKASLGGGIVKDAWSDTVGVAFGAAVVTRSTNNTPHVTGKTLVTTGNKTATYLNTHGIHDLGTGTAITLGVNDFAVAATSKVPATTATHRFSGLAAFERQVTGPLGTAAAPTYSFDGDTNTGIFSSTADDISIATAGTLRARWGTTGLLMSEGYNFAFGGTTGTKHGTATTQKQAWWGATPVVRPTGTPAAATDLATALTLLNDIRSKLITIGLIG